MQLLQPLIELINMILPPLISLFSNIIQFILPGLQSWLGVVASVISGVFLSAFESIKTHVELVKNTFQNVLDFIKNIFTGNWKGAWENVKNIFSNIISGLGNIFKASINLIISGINGFIRGLNKIKIPDWVPAVGGLSLNIKEIPKLKVGIDYVPEDDFPALLHKGEAVLTKEQNAEYIQARSRQQNTGYGSDNNSSNLEYLVQKLIDILLTYFPQFTEIMKQPLVTDDGTIIAYYTPKFNEELNKIKDKDYIANRALTCFIMLIGATFYLIFKQYSSFKTTIFALLAIFKGLEAFSDILYGVMQKNGILYKSGKSLFAKGFIGILFFLIVDIITRDLRLACLAVIVVNLVILVLYDYFITTRKLIDNKYKVDLKNVTSIFKSEFFVFVNSFAGIYILNAPKYAIDGYLTEDVQAIYGYIMMPATVMTLFTQFIVMPFLGKLKEMYEQKGIETNHQRKAGAPSTPKRVSCVRVFWFPPMQLTRLDTRGKRDKQAKSAQTDRPVKVMCHRMHGI